jgi:hypothetical protein
VPIVASQVQNLAVLQVGECPDNRLQMNVALIWEQAAWAATLYPPLQAAYTRLGLIDLALGYYRDQVNTSIDGTSMAYQQRVDSLLKMRATVEGQISQYQAMARAARGGVAAPITQVTPELPPDLAPPSLATSLPDRNDEWYQGDVYLPDEPFLG